MLVTLLPTLHKVKQDYPTPEKVANPWSRIMNPTFTENCRKNHPKLTGLCLYSLQESLLVIFVSIQQTVPACKGVTGITEQHQRFMLMDRAVDSLLPCLWFGGASRETVTEWLLMWTVWLAGTKGILFVCLICLAYPPQVKFIIFFIPASVIRVMRPSLCVTAYLWIGLYGP